MNDAAAATTINPNATTANVTTSTTGTPTSSERSSRSTPAAPTTPIATPTTAIRIPSPSTDASTVERSAPSAIRTPISKRRSDTPYEITPKIPIPAKTSASAANPPSSIVLNRRFATEIPTTCSSVRTFETGTVASSDRTIALTSFAITSGSPTVRTTRFMLRGMKYADFRVCGYAKYIVGSG